MANEINRRDFLKFSGATASAGALALGTATEASAAETQAGRTTLPYKPKLISKVSNLKANTPVAFSFPDADSPCVLIKMGRTVPGGVGPERDIVAFSTLCTHMGCPVAYDTSTSTFRCGCHYSVFDPEMGGQMVCGQATEDLPQVLLRYDEKSQSVSAVSVSGLIYGRQSNVL